jgi:arylsulfatase A-like enzyme
MKIVQTIKFLVPILILSISAQAATQKQPNILLIVADDLGYADVGFNGAKDIKTPNIDELATSGVQLKSLYAQQMCTPTRAALMTGRYPMRYGLQTYVITPGQSYGLAMNETTLAQVLKDAGYKTYVTGKWHLGHADKKYWPQNRGFDYFYGCTLGEVDHYSKERAGVIDWQRNGEHLKEEGYFTDLITKDAVRIIGEQKSDEPFFLYMPHLAVHAPYQAPKEYTDRYKELDNETRQIYAAMTTAMDDSIGAVMKALEERGLRENTIIIFMSDNGGIAEYDAAAKKAKGDRPAPANNTPWRGSKGSLYEGGVRSASLINWPRHIKPAIVNEPLHVVDLFPTLVKLAGASLPKAKPIDGKDIWSVLTEGESSPHDTILINAEFNRGAVRQGDWKLVKYATLPSSVELYNLADDPSETNNIASTNPKKVAELEEILNSYAKESNGSLFIKEYMPFIKNDFQKATLAFDGNEDAGAVGEKPRLPKE